MLRNKKGFTGVDISIAVLAIIIFTSTILALMSNVKLENLKMHTKLLANIYLTETLENIGIAEYDNVVSSNMTLITEMPEAFNTTINVEKISEEDASKTQDIIKKVTVTISYKVLNKTYEVSAQRLKIKE